MIELGPKIVAKREETLTLNWQFRKKYLLGQIIAYDQMQHVEHNAPYYFIHYLSEQYGASMARMTESEWQDLLEEPGVKTALDQIPYSDTSTDEPYVPHEERTMALMLGQAVEQPLLKLKVDTQGEVLDPDNAFMIQQVEALANIPIVDHANLVANTPIQDKSPVMEAAMQKIKEVAQNHDLEIVIAKSPVQVGDGEVPELSEAETLQLLGKDKPARKPRARKETPPPPPPPAPTPEPVVLLPLVVPEFKSLLMYAPLENTPERRFITHPTDLKEVYVIKGSTDKFYTYDGNFHLLFDALLHHAHPIATDVLFYMAPPYAKGTNNLGDGGAAWQRLSDEVLLSTATAYFAGRALGVVLTHFKNSDQPQGDLIQQWLLGELGDMGNQMTPDSVLGVIEGEQHRTHQDALDRVRLPLRLLHQLVRVSQQPVGNPPADKAPQSVKDWHRLVWASRRICWHLNITTPSGYAFLQGMLTFKRLGFTRAENSLLGDLLELTNKLPRK